MKQINNDLIGCYDIYVIFVFLDLVYFDSIWVLFFVNILCYNWNIEVFLVDFYGEY